MLAKAEVNVHFYSPYVYTHRYEDASLPDVPKKYPPKNFANFSRTIDRYDIKFYALVAHSIFRKCRKFHYIIYSSDKIDLLLVTAT